MSIKKYLERIDLPDPQPGPFALRLKYDLHREFFERRRTWGWYPVVSTSLASGLLIVVSLLVMRPQWANQLHASLFERDLPVPIETSGVNLPAKVAVQPNTTAPTIADEQVLPGEHLENGIAIPEHPKTIARQVNAQADSTANAFPHLDDDKSYLIRKIRVPGNRSLYYVSELQSETPKVTY